MFKAIVLVGLFLLLELFQVAHAKANETHLIPVETVRSVECYKLDQYCEIHFTNGRVKEYPIYTLVHLFPVAPPSRPNHPVTCEFLTCTDKHRRFVGISLIPF